MLDNYVFSVFYVLIVLILLFPEDPPWYAETAMLLLSLLIQSFILVDVKKYWYSCKYLYSLHSFQPNHLTPLPTTHVTIPLQNRYFATSLIAHHQVIRISTASCE